MHTNHDNGSTPKSIKASFPPSLPNEILLYLFRHVVKLHPNTLSTLNLVCKDWFIIIKVFKSHLWRTATFSRFPTISSHELRDDLSFSRVISNKHDWKETFLINSNWSVGQAQTLILKASRPPVTEEEPGLQDHSMSEPQGGQSPAQLQSQHHHHHHHHLQNEYNEAIQNMDQVRYVQPTQEVQPVLKDPLPQEIFNQGRSASEEIEALSCSFCVYTDVCMIPQARICVRTYRDRSGPLMQVLDWGLQIVIKIDDLVNSHQDLISGMAVNDQGTLLASCSIDGTVRVWNIQSPWCQSGTGGGATAKSFKENLEKHGCPIVSHTLLLGHIGWVNAVDIKNTTIVSGGSDHTTRIWDGISGKIIRIIPNLFLTRQLNLGVYVVAIHGSLIGSGSIIEGYQIHDLETGELVMDLDEPLCSKDHARFESELYQLYSSNMVITDTVIVTNSKLEGMLCVWDRHTGDFLYRIQVSPTQNSAIDLTSNESTASSDIKQLKTYTSSACSKHIGTSPDVNIVTVHSFKVNRSGSRLICTLCDGSVSLIDFKKLPSAQMNPWNVEYNVRAPLEQVGAPNSSATAWVWVQDARNGNRVMLI